MLGDVKRAAADAARAAVLFGLAGLCIGVGVAFLTAAGWSRLATMRGPVFASAAVGAGYCVLALVLVGLGTLGARRQKRRVPLPPAPPPSPPLQDAFFAGLDMGRRVRGGRAPREGS